MAVVKPFAALRPNPALASRICELPYDVVSSEEAAQAALGNPLSFFHVSKPEIDLPPGTDPCAEIVYRKARENFDRLRAEGHLRPDSAESFYLYRQVMGQHSQTGFVAAASCQQYLDGAIKKHEFTRPDKEEDRLKHIEALDAQTGPAFLAYRSSPELDEVIAEGVRTQPDTDFVAADGVRHTAWAIRDPQRISQIEELFRAVPALYIADGHHRSAAAARIYQKRQGAGRSGHFLTVIFPHTQVQILPYNRVLTELHGAEPDAFLEQLKSVFVVEKAEKPEPAEVHEAGLYLAKRWWRLRFKPELLAGGSPVENLDAALLQKHVLAPLLGIDDPRTSKRVNFVGGIRGTAELEKLVNSGQYACAFAMHPTSIEELMSVADSGGIMPPKSTWFEPKLRDGMFSHLI
jgi:uncharacterized protein (DUF1015 family)